jgi:alkylation response protein AidB-like acyl-CoA dehydrogenase
MEFELSDDQLALRDAARSLLAARATPKRVREVADKGDLYDTELWAEMAAQGWPAIELGESGGGLGLGAVETAVLLEEIGRHVAPAPVLSTVLALGALVRAADNGVAGAAEWVAPLAEGRAIGCVVWEPERAGEPVIDGPAADVAVVLGAGEVVALDLRDGARPAREAAMDLTRPIGRLSADRPAPVALGDTHAADDLIDRAAVAHSAELLGAASAALDLAVAYAKEREQFGRPIGSFQAVKHRCADMLVDVEGMRSAVYWAAWCIAAGHPDRSIAASTAKTWSADAAKRVLASALQVHGGIGFTWEHDLHLFLKRAHLSQVSCGDATWHRARLARLLRARVDAGESVV